MDDLPFVKNEWPQKGDRIFAKLKVNKNQLTARPLSRYQIREHLRPVEPLKEGQVVEATNIFKAEEGNVFCTDQGHLIFVYFKHMRERFRLGQRASMTILIDKGDFEYNGTMIEHKEKMLEEDAARLVAYMESHDMMMPYTDSTSPEIIQMVFKMSKSAFKRALGTLYKERLIAFDEDKTRLLKPLNIDDN
jgi:predicted RNA-binding protein (virulence factor B family)